MPKFGLQIYGVNMLNRLHADQVNDLTDKDLRCWSCGEYWQQGDLIVIKKHTTRGSCLIVKRHATCAILKNVITREDLRKLKAQYRTFGFGVIFSFFCLYSSNSLQILGGLL